MQVQERFICTECGRTTHAVRRHENQANPYPCYNCGANTWTHQVNDGTGWMPEVKVSDTSEAFHESSEKRSIAERLLGLVGLGA